MLGLFQTKIVKFKAFVAHLGVSEALLFKSWPSRLFASVLGKKKALKPCVYVPEGWNRHVYVSICNRRKQIGYQGMTLRDLHLRVTFSSCCETVQREFTKEITWLQSICLPTKTSQSGEDLN